jgi:dihydropteroate synthase
MQYLKFRNRELRTGETTRLMGILNVTPDSFSDGGNFNDTKKAVDHALEMFESGAEIIDIGGESTRPGAPAVDAKEEISRVIPVISELKSLNEEIIISIDTTKPDVASAALSEGADIVNDVSGLQSAPEIANIAAEHNAGLILMHMRGTPETMKQMCDYEDLTGEISSFLLQSADTAISKGVNRENIMLDPGIGFAKNSHQNLEIMGHIAKFAELGYPLLVGPSRKSFIGDTLEIKEPKDRIWGTAGAIAWLTIHRVDFIRVHDVKKMHDIIKIIEAIQDFHH